MIQTLFDHSKSHSDFDIFSQRGDKYSLKHGQDNLYFRMCTSDKSFRVGFQQYSNGRLYLSMAVNSEKHISIVTSAHKAISALSHETIQNCKSRTGQSLNKSWEIEMGCRSVDALFSLQEVLLSYFETKI